MSEPDNAREAGLLLDRAEGDLKALESLIGDDDQADHVLGLLAQQSIEKSAKAILVARGEESPHTHDLTYLFRLLRDAGIEVPAPMATGDSLGPWAGHLRYESTVPPLDRAESLTAARAAVEWARAQLPRL